MIADDICYVCGLFVVVKDGRCAKCQAVNKSQRDAYKAAHPKKVYPNHSRVLKKGPNDFTYDGIKVGD